MIMNVSFESTLLDFQPTFESTLLEFEPTFDEVVIVRDDKISVYEGDYFVTPKITQQSMNTAQKFMVNDVTIAAIPFYETSNLSGGNTVYIGKELE